MTSQAACGPRGGLKSFASLVQKFHRPPLEINLPKLAAAEENRRKIWRFLPQRYTVGEDEKTPNAPIS